MAELAEWKNETTRMLTDMHIGTEGMTDERYKKLLGTVDEAYQSGLAKMKAATPADLIDKQLSQLDEMKKAKKKHYEYQGLEIEIVTTKEKVTVKLRKEDEDEDGPS